MGKELLLLPEQPDSHSKDEASQGHIADQVSENQTKPTNHPTNQPSKQRNNQPTKQPSKQTNNHTNIIVIIVSRQSLHLRELYWVHLICSLILI